MLLAGGTPLSFFYTPPNKPLLNPQPPSSLLKSRDFATTTTIFSTTTQSLISSIQSPPTRLLATPPSGKFLRKDYLIQKFSAKEIQDLVKGERNVPLIIDFYATWCGPCTLMAQELEMIAVEYESNAMIVKVDTDDEYEFARDMQVRGLPTLYFISPDPSKDAIRTEGLIPIQMIRDIIDKDM